MLDIDEREAKLLAILERLSASLTPPERAEVDLFVTAGEYGLALETLRDIIVEESKAVSRLDFADIDALAHGMGIREAIITDDLRRRVS